MRNEKHLSDETLNAYMDGELSASERDSAEAHMTTCEICRIEMQALQELFTALDTVTDVPAPNMASSVLTSVQPRRKLATLHRLIPAFQGVAAIALLAWSWTRLASYWAVFTNALPIKTLSGVWKQAGEWVIAQWAVLNTLPNTTWSNVQNWIARLTPSTSPGLPLPQLVIASVVVGMLWLVCNVTLLRRSPLNGHKTQG